MTGGVNRGGLSVDGSENAPAAAAASSSGLPAGGLKRLLPWSFYGAAGMLRTAETHAHSNLLADLGEVYRFLPVVSYSPP